MPRLWTAASDRIQPYILMRADLAADERHFYQDVFPGEDRIVPGQQRVHNFAHFFPTQHG